MFNEMVGSSRIYLSYSIAENGIRRELYFIAMFTDFKTFTLRYMTGLELLKAFQKTKNIQLSVLHHFVGREIVG